MQNQKHAGMQNAISYGKMHAIKWTDLGQDLSAKIENRGAKMQNNTTAQHSKRTEKKILKSTDIQSNLAWYLIKN